ncbi:MAG TPA: ribosome biogenesis GTPase Der [Clostridiales bacterium]|nr:ribosome biogenesis GTPase Der [Clostridiales bacterium]
MTKPIVAIVGRPNVGKSTLFNYLAGSRISIVEDTPGVTRDRIYAKTEWLGKEFIIIDTGGIEPVSSDDIMVGMRMQAEIAIETADVIIFMTDGKSGLIESDKDIAQMLRLSKKPIVIVVNKVDTPGDPPMQVYDFYELALGEIHTISSIHGMGIGDALDEVISYFPEETEEEEEEHAIKVAVIGKPNSGKSSLVNKVLGYERVLVSDVPGTTRDAIDSYVEVDGKQYVFIDTAGIRRQSKVIENVEKYSVLRAYTAIERADVCILMVDGGEGISEQDAKIAGYAHEQGKSIIVAINKWDLVEKDSKTVESFQQKTFQILSFMTYAPMITISALTGQRINRLFPLIDEVYAQASLDIPTGVLNDILSEAIAMVQPPSHKGKRLKIFYMTQVGKRPPKFVLFVNDVQLMHFSYERYITNKLREAFEFKGTSIQFIIRERNEKV